MGVLDNKNYISQYDAQDALGFAARQPEQLSYGFNIAGVPQGGINSVVFAGMGGSSLVAELAMSWPRLKVPFVVCKNYSLPEFVNSNTLVIVSSYSGNTEETLSALADAEQRGAKIVVMAHGGKLTERGKGAGSPLAAIPECPRRRTSIFYAYRALVEILAAAGLTPKSSIDELAALAEPLQKAVSSWYADVPEPENLAKQLAQIMAGKTPIIFGGPLMYPAAYKWKIDTNENAKNTAWCNAYPEFNHNEFIGWSSHPIEKPFAVINLISSFEHPRILKRFEVSDRLLSGKWPKAVNIQAQGGGVLEHMLYLVLCGDFATTYLAILNGINPTPVGLVEKLKVELGQHGSTDS